jgi:hypothetical protein
MLPRSSEATTTSVFQAAYATAKFDPPDSVR